MMDTPSPYWGVFRWARYHAKEFRARFWVATVLFSLIVSFVLFRLPLPPHPTAIENLVASVLGIVGATILTGIISYGWALVAAPYQQRNVLRSQQSEAAATIAALRATPVSQEHGDRLRQIAARLRERLEHKEPLRP
jgi:uncharacterized membrane protein YccC